jgi:hypothetical protein
MPGGGWGRVSGTVPDIQADTRGAVVVLRRSGDGPGRDAVRPVHPSLSAAAAAGSGGGPCCRLHRDPRPGQPGPVAACPAPAARRLHGRRMGAMMRSSLAAPVPGAVRGAKRQCRRAVSIGEDLAEARRRAGLTVTQVSQQTRIRGPVGQMAGGARTCRLSPAGSWQRDRLVLFVVVGADPQPRRAGWVLGPRVRHGRGGPAEPAAVAELSRRTRPRMPATRRGRCRGPA